MQKTLSHFSANGDFDIKSAAAFRLQFTEGCATAIHHIDGLSVKVPSHIQITRTFVLQSWWADELCFAELRPQRLFMKDFFPKNEGPNRGSVVKKEMFAAVKRDAGAAAPAASSSSVALAPPPPLNAPALKQSVAASRKKAADKAKDALAKFRASKLLAAQITLEV